MSIYGAMMIGVAGLSANSRALSVASSNIANVNTIGYKASSNAFTTLLASAVGTGDVSSAGVTANQQQHVTEQGGLMSTTSATDLAISGNGFFVVSPSVQTPGASQAQLYTRAGNFVPDSKGNLQNAAGFYLLGWPLASDGSVPTDRNDLTNINVQKLAGKAEATTKMSLQMNLQASTPITSPYTPGAMAAGTVAPAFQRTINVYDSQGGTQPLQVSYVKTGANTWSYEVTYQGAGANIGSPAHNILKTGTMSFNADGTLANADNTASPATGAVSVTIPWVPGVAGLNPQTISINMGTVGGSDGVTQFDNPSALVSSNVDGSLFGALTGVVIDNNGFVTAQFSNGLSQKVFKIPVATFANPDGLSAVTGNAYTASLASGTPTVGEANLGGAGLIQSKSLEGSTSDLATEFTNLITTQRAYSASARIVTTADQMLQTLEQIQ
ncbi:MAG: flagellar hook protein FlgE [Alphaproteobacteria bacterium]|nr:flagellar hook protein FlgE [Alphaproteobacteria bacterium]MBL6938562.1 flagellar hook protein FlgE [Alphaproteobacteria bacterium]MBL7098081.1 flagellar hook protein FlgE [Alphaproteobacteria bacterium]